MQIKHAPEGRNDGTAQSSGKAQASESTGHHEHSTYAEARRLESQVTEHCDWRQLGTDLQELLTYNRREASRVESLQEELHVTKCVINDMREQLQEARGALAQAAEEKLKLIQQCASSAGAVLSANHAKRQAENIRERADYHDIEEYCQYLEKMLVDAQMDMTSAQSQQEWLENELLMNSRWTSELLCELSEQEEIRGKIEAERSHSEQLHLNLSKMLVNAHKEVIDAKKCENLLADELVSWQCKFIEARLDLEKERRALTDALFRHSAAADAYETSNELRSNLAELCSELETIRIENKRLSSELSSSIEGRLDFEEIVWKMEADHADLVEQLRLDQKCQADTECELQRALKEINDLHESLEESRKDAISAQEELVHSKRRADALLEELKAVTTARQIAEAEYAEDTVLLKQRIQELSDELTEHKLSCDYEEYSAVANAEVLLEEEYNTSADPDMEHEAQRPALVSVQHIMGPTPSLSNPSMALYMEAREVVRNILTPPANSSGVSDPGSSEGNVHVNPDGQRTSTEGSDLPNEMTFTEGTHVLAMPGSVPRPKGFVNRMRSQFPSLNIWRVDDRTLMWTNCPDMGYALKGSHSLSKRNRWIPAYLNEITAMTQKDQIELVVGENGKYYYVGSYTLGRCEEWADRFVSLPLQAQQAICAKCGTTTNQGQVWEDYHCGAVRVLKYPLHRVGFNVHLHEQWLSV
ncbi:hypothetical protein WOLCODRAFT_163324 [Wolfiporia cocos MD-104 SS10]|uniref:Uncharacterized protein n=1 Tax=Wolfiporia cocos (strain MD-104) TaxID=742152 RepID=A0A2H3JHQ4_WOLCO|nr:hypothetical protein WOLCODRAFT_163324 [Wolfiporia cocos MD-104 SS10]